MCNANLNLFPIAELYSETFNSFKSFQYICRQKNKAWNYGKELLKKRYVCL